MKTKLTILALTFVAGFACLGQTTVFATDGAPATSKAHVKLVSNNTVTRPVDPTNPDNPNPPGDPHDPNNNGTGHQGPLSIDYASNISFGGHVLSQNDTIVYAANANPFVQVTDNRGTGSGWVLRAKAAPFTDETGTKILKGAIVTFKNGAVRSFSSNVSAPPIAKDVQFSNEDFQVVMSAANGTGSGTWVDTWQGKENQNQNIQVKVSKESGEVGVYYQSNITWELSDAP